MPEQRDRLSALWRVWRGRLLLLLNLAALLCALAGSWLYLAPKISSTGHLLSSTAFSVIKLFLFSPDAGLVEPVPLAYTVAMWLCPLCTAVAVFRLLESSLRHALGGLSRFFRSYTLVCGQGEEDCLRLVENLRHSDGFFRRKVVLVTETPLPVDRRLPLERSGVTVFAVPLAGGTAAERTSGLRRLKLSRADGAVLVHPEAALNFAILRALEAFLQAHPRRGGELPCALFTGDGSMEPLISQYRRERQGPDGSALDLKYFSTAALAARDLFRRVPLGALSLNRGEPAPTRLLIAGLGTCGEAVLLQAAALCPTAPGAATEITLLDQDAARKLHRINARYPQLGRFIDLRAVELDVLSDELFERLMDEDFTYAAVCFRDPALALRAAEALGRLDGEFPIGVRLDGGDALAACLDESGGPFRRAFPFGDRATLLTRELVLGPKLDEDAMAFHAAYRAQETALFPNKASLSPPWDALDRFKKDSARAQAAYYRSYLKPLRDKLLSQDELDVCRALLREVKDAPEQLRALLSTHPALALLARLEHERWCGFLYAHGYAGSSGGTESAPSHPCLVPWETLLRDDQTCKTVCYDLIPLLFVSEMPL